ncbi:MAG: lysophospholipid acyltransferase family protein [Candidatus Marinimicrobia bacterium]|jgi:lysophospholipid acyltransferase (LPLAT)-like uncharacterized protein|nr:lysophospholipid acyltransferase family protein [Candidatus Neomarinimicrobiota bacterium]MDP6789630.1 lysophospholipid acyltransferase family protein [Candidatus Neomarinimicrobiota bacterium]MDP7072336.1 lysophospholipid acyltransferase family protein [Candidatus Neomarinimicrobiota bacterium]
MKKNFIFWLGIMLGKPILKFLYNTNRWNVGGEHYITDTLSSGKSVIVACWHDCLLIPFMHLSGKNHFGIAGTHGDAEIISRIGEKLGWQVLRGSSTERGKEVYDELLDVLKQPGNLVAITPDGPKGPAKVPKAGAIRAAQKTGALIIPMSGRSTKSWGFTNWDTFLVAKPFGTIEVVYGEPIDFKLDDPFEDCANKLTEALNCLEKAAIENVESHTA